MILVDVPLMKYVETLKLKVNRIWDKDEHEHDIISAEVGIWGSK